MATDFVDEEQSETVPDCTECGACCFSNLERYVKVTGSDYARMGDDADRWVTFDGHSAYLRMQGGHCAALEVDLVTNPSATLDRSCAASKLGGRFTCATYETRPDTCRTLERGGPMCRAEREAKASRAWVAVAALRKRRDC